MKEFNEVYQDNIQKLLEILPVLERVHGKEHPEIIEVKKLTYSFIANVFNENRVAIFKEIYNTTNGFEVPNGTCETYELSYKLLKEIYESINQQ